MKTIFLAVIRCFRARLECLVQHDMGDGFTNIQGKSRMKTNYLHTGNATKKSSARARPVFRAFGAVAAVTLAGFALAAGPEHSSVRSSKSQIVAENPDASSGKNPIAEKYD